MSANTIENSEAYRGDCLPSIIEKDGISAADEVEPCEYCGGIDQCRYDCPAPTLTAEQAYNENVLRNEGGRRCWSD